MDGKARSKKDYLRKAVLSLLNLMESITEENKKGRMVAIKVPVAFASELQEMFKDVPGDNVLPADCHVTIGMFDKSTKNNKIYSIIEKAVDKIKSFKLKTVKFNVFPGHKGNEFKDVLHVECESDDLMEIHQFLKDEFESKKIDMNNGGFDFKPHITIKYCEGKVPEEFLKQPIENTFKVNSISFYVNSNVIPFRLR